VVNLWASWCPPCRHEMPVLQQAQAANTDVNFVFVNQGETPGTIRSYMDRRALTLRNVLVDAQLQVGSLCLDTVGRLATLNGKTLELSARELNVLEILMLSAGRVVSKERLCEQISGLGELVSDNAIEVYMYRLRKHLKSGGINIRTVRGLGYMLEKQ